MKVKYTDFVPWLEIKGIRDIILEKISILDILDMYDIEYRASSAGNFTHKAICSFHNDGKERTPSFCISTKTNSCFCFGCNISLDPISFISKKEGTPNQIIVDRLAKFIGIVDDNSIKELNITKVEKNDFRSELEDVVFNSGALIRDFIKSLENPATINKAIKWSDKQFIALDALLDDYTEENLIKAKERYNKIKEYLDKKAS